MIFKDYFCCTFVVFKCPHCSTHSFGAHVRVVPLALYRLDGTATSGVCGWHKSIATDFASSRLSRLARLLCCHLRVVVGVAVIVVRSQVYPYLDTVPTVLCPVACSYDV